MDFDLTAEQKMLRETLFALGRDVSRDLVERDHAGTFSLEGWRQCGAVGLHGLPIPEVWGGADADVITTALALESFGAGCRDEGLTFSICAHMQSCAIPLLESG